MTMKTIKSLNEIKAVVTGAASGLGLATASYIIRQGGQVALLDINKTLLEQVVKPLGDRAMVLTADVTKEVEVDVAIAQAVQQFGNINLAVNCAGIAPSKRVLGRDGLLSSDAFSQVISVNLISTFCVSRAAANAMQHNPAQEDNERGVIVNTASIAAFDGQIGQAAYAASKGGIVSMTLPLAREFARFGIRVLSIAPGLFKTPLFDTLPATAVEALEQAIPFPSRLGDPDEFAALVCHIFQNTMLNGETIRLDGALRMGT